MSDDAGEKKFELSGRRRGELRQKGSVASSHDVLTTTTLAVGLSSLVCGGGVLIGFLREVMIKAFMQSGGSSMSATTSTITSIFSGGWWLWLASFMTFMAIAIFTAQASQVGLVVTDEAFSPKFDRLNPLTNVKKIFSIGRAVQVGQSLVKLVVVASFAYMAFGDIQRSAVFSRPVSVEELGKIYTDIAWSLGWRIIMALAVLAAGDYFFQNWKFNHDNRMTLEEVKEERRSMEASPEIIKKRRLLGRKFSMRRMLENVQDATIVLTNPTHYAVALKYKRGETQAPIVVAKGSRRNALRIKERAYDLRIPVREDKPLTRGLYKYGKVGHPIPPMFYQVVAVILAALYRQGLRPSEESDQMVRSINSTTKDNAGSKEKD